MPTSISIVRSATTTRNRTKFSLYVEEASLPLCGGGGTEDDDNRKVGDKNKEQDKPLPLHGGGVTEDDEDLPLCGGGGTEDDENSKCENISNEFQI